MKEILITGAGSLGEAFIKLLHERYKLTVIENSEWTVARLSKEYPDVKFLLEDFSEWKFDQNPVEYVIATAAYKHLPLGEDNPNSFIDNNIIKLRKLFAEAYKCDVDLLFVSTDKAVEPCSLYGYTKAIGESLAKYYNFSITRCGNIMGSSGSVIPVWEDQISKNKPLTITNPEMTRYFISVDQAANEMWRGFCAGIKLIIPEMGEPVKLEDIANKVLFEHDEDWTTYPKEIIGLRPHEKMHERLRWENE